MTTVEVSVISVIVTGVVGVLGYSAGISKGESSKRRRMYERLDEHKEYIDDTFVRKDICSERTKRIEDKLDKLLEKNGIK